MPTQGKQRFLGKTRHVHMVGIGGVGMSSIAEVLLRRGYAVSGSDLRGSEITDRLAQLGATIYEGHLAEHVGNADVVVYSSAVHPDANPETIEAERRRIPLIRRAEMLGELMRMKYGVAIGGTHGKTTTTSLVGLIAEEAQLDPTVIVGGKVAAFGAGAVSGEGDLIVIEADEYDRTFLRLTPIVAVVTSIDAEHLDIYTDLADLQGAFVQFANSVPFFGAVVVCLDDPHVQAVLDRIEKRVITYGLSRQALLRAEDLEHTGTSSSFTVQRGREDLGRFTISQPGLHNVRNALAAVGVALELELPLDAVRAGLARFSGVERRFEVKGAVGDILVVDDYAHHPKEVDATLQAASSAYPGRRIVAVFQPHLYTRTRDFLDDFARSFLNADFVVVTEVYAAREEPIPGVSGRGIVERARAYGHHAAHFVPEKNDLPATLETLVHEGDVVITMGAGDVWRAGEALLTRLRAGKTNKQNS